MSLAEAALELAPEAVSTADEWAKMVYGLALYAVARPAFRTVERDFNESLDAVGSGLSKLFSDLGYRDLPSISDRRRWHPTPSSQPDLGWLMDGTPVPGVVPFEDIISRPGRPGRVLRPGRPGRNPAVKPRAITRPAYGGAWSRAYSYAHVSPRDVADCVRRDRRRHVLFAKRRLRSHAPRRRRPGGVSCYGW